MSEEKVLPQYNYLRPVLITTLSFIAVGLTASGVIHWWKKHQCPAKLKRPKSTHHDEVSAFTRGIKQIDLEIQLIAKK